MATHTHRNIFVYIHGCIPVATVANYCCFIGILWLKCSNEFFHVPALRFIEYCRLKSTINSHSFKSSIFFFSFFSQWHGNAIESTIFSYAKIMLLGWLWIDVFSWTSYSFWFPLQRWAPAIMELLFQQPLLQTCKVTIQLQFHITSLFSAVHLPDFPAVNLSLSNSCYNNKMRFLIISV